jgi:DNA segregation ATPase FtsK/SpoIIIE-like protein
MPSRVARGTGLFVQALLEEPPEDTGPAKPTPTFTEDRQRAVRVVRHQYAAQLLPWKVLAAALVAGLFVDTQDWSPWGVLPWTFVIAVASFLATEWRLGGRHLKSGRIDWGNPRGRKQRRIRQRALRSAAMSVCTGVWLIAVTVTDPGHAGGRLVWLAGAGLWATFSYHGWWKPAETSQVRQDSPLPIHEQPDGDDIDDPAPASVSAPVAAARRPARVPASPTPATDATVPAAGVTDVQLPDAGLLGTVTDTIAVPGHEDLTAVVQKVLDDHGLKAKVIEAVRAPAVTRYGIKVEAGQQVDAILRRKRDFAMACGTRRLLMHAPIEGSPLIGVEVPNKERSWVTLGEVLACREAQRDPHPLLVAIGKDADGNYLLANLRKLPHVLFGGETGGGKSGGIDAIIMSILMRAIPDEVRFLLIDVKRVELSRYEGIPHLVMPVITKAERAAEALQWVLQEMDLRYDEMERARVRDIDDLNEKIIAGVHKAPPGAGYTMRPFAYLVVVVDELADLMMLDENDAVEEAVIRIGQLARAAGIHLVLATQNPVVKVITGRIKANIPSRIAYRTANHTDSSTILGETGAELLLGAGDCIVKLSGKLSVRVQGARADEDEVAAVVKSWRAEAAHKGLSLPAIKLASTPSDDKPVQGRVTAYDSVLSAAIRLQHPITGQVTKDQIRSDTPHIGEAARSNALTRLFEDGALDKVPGHQALYQIPRGSNDNPVEQESEEQQ